MNDLGFSLPSRLVKTLRHCLNAFRESEIALNEARSALAKAEQRHAIAAQDLACAKSQLCAAAIEEAAK